MVSVTTPFLLVMGVAKPLLTGALNAARLLRPCVRLRANRREAMAAIRIKESKMGMRKNRERERRLVGTINR